MEKRTDRMKRYAAWMGKLFQNHWKSMLYYGGVVIVLSAVAYAAEVYRTDDAAHEVILPAVEITEKVDKETPELYLPEGMELIRGFSKDPLWNGELEQWESHTASDYRLRENEVRALADGRVICVETGKNGNCIEIAHGDLILRYASVCADVKLTANAEVKAGEIIGTADESLTGEAYLGAHLHLEAIYNEELAEAERFIMKKDAPQADS